MDTIREVKQLKKIHESNISTVFTGMDASSGQKLAIKVLNDEFPSLHSIARFNEEAELGQSFKISGLRKILGRQKINNRHALLMEYIEGKTFRELIDHQSSLDLQAFFNLAINACNVINDIHQYDMIHKDINPRNLLFGDNNQVYLIDLGIATIAKKQSANLEAPDKLEGTLAYIAPEQTGRMNHSIDTRSDLYSLGVTFYEMLTGKVPFESTDSMELVHSHIAKIPQPPSKKNAEVPKILSDIVLKLMAKDSDDRYQTASGLKLDLVRCQTVFSDQGSKALQQLVFELGTQDFNSKFQIPEKLYGRGSEQQLLLDSFEKCQQGGFETLVIGGYSGVGKTALIEELYKPVTESRGYFISGKFGQFQRDIPYNSIVSAINNLVQQLLGEPSVRLEKWKSEMLASLGANGGVLTELVPSLELIIGKQDPPQPLTPTESQNRFTGVMLRFFHDLSTKEHPIVLFIDDWQWADLSSIHLLKNITSDASNQFFMLLLAYRNNEVDASHPFIIALDEIKETKKEVSTLILQPLEKRHVSDMIQDTLKANAEEVASLTQLVESKTSGNPFFVAQFLQKLYDGGYIQYDVINHVWKWDIEVLQQLPISNNVLDLMTARIETLSEDAKKLLCTAACVGNTFPLRLVAHLCNQSQMTTRNILLEALEQGLVIPYKGNHYSVEEGNEADLGIYFRFLHDRVEQAAYQLNSTESINQVSLDIARFSYHQTTKEYRQEWVCEIASYYNKGAQLIEEESERLLLMNLDLEAALKAKRSAAYQSALNYIHAAIEILPEDAWESLFDLSFELHKQLADCFYLNGDKEEAEQYFELVLQKAKTRLQKIQIYNLKNLLYESSGRYADSIAVARLSLALLDIHLPENDDEKLEAFGKEVANISTNITEKGGSAFLKNLPEIKDPELREALKILYLTWTSCYMAGDMNLVLLTSAKMVSLAIEHGNTPETAWAYVAYATFVSSGAGNYGLGYELGEVAIELNDQQGELQPRGTIHHLMGTFIYFWKNPLKQNIQFFKTAFESSLSTGNYGYAGYAHGVRCRQELLLGINLNELAEKNDGYVAQQYQIKNHGIAQTVVVVNAFVKNFLGRSNSIESFDNKEFTEQSYLETFAAIPLFEAVYQPLKARMYLLHDQYEQSLEHTKKAIPVMPALFGTLWNVFQNVNYSLGLCGLLREVAVDSDTRSSHLQQVQENQKQLKAWADNCPENFLHHYQLIESELAQIEGRVIDALSLYDEAIASAQENEFINDVAMANELAMKFYLSIDKKDFARIYYQKALYAYETWGATTKVQQMREQYAEVFPFAAKRKTSGGGNTAHTITASGTVSMHTRMGGTNHTTTGGGDGLDLLSVMKASQAISQEIKLDLLLKKMISVLMENAGAERALLIQDRGENLMLAAEAHVGKEDIEVMRELPLEHKDAQNMALSLIRTVYRTEETIVLDDVRKDPRFAIDEYVKKGKAKSILCMPIMTHGKVRVVIYMEHNSIAGAFTEDRLQVLNMLSSQVGISIENANLYDTMEIKVAERTAELQEKNARITDSINYALTMQQAILPSEEDLKRISDDFFVLFLPKDIVSGDFYWHTTVGNKEVLAVIDCTGHGVPGAFMSMIGNTLLNEIINQKEVINPAEIMTALDQGVQVAMHQETGQNSDGMDLVLCVFEKLADGTTKIEFTGAKNSLYFIKDGAFGRLNADRRAIGGFGMRSKRKPFTTQELILSKGDTLYMLTDGYVDSAGEKTRLSFSKKRFFDLTEAHWQKPMAAQYDIFSKTLKEFQGKMQQRDDITVVGFKM